MTLNIHIYQSTFKNIPDKKYCSGQNYSIKTLTRFEKKYTIKLGLLITLHVDVYLQYLMDFFLIFWTLFPPITPLHPKKVKRNHLRTKRKNRSPQLIFYIIYHIKRFSFSSFQSFLFSFFNLFHHSHSLLC